MKNKRAKIAKQKQIDSRIQHCLKRAWQRYDFKLTRDDINHMSALVRRNSPEVELIRKTTNSKKVYLVPYRDTKMLLPCAYNATLGCIVSVLKIEWLEGKKTKE